METYTVLRAFADSWMLLFMSFFFLSVIVWALWPSRSKVYKEIEKIPFMYDEKPAPKENKVIKNV